MASGEPVSRLGAYGWFQVLLRLVMRAFFRRVEVAGLGHVPEQGGGVLVAWHPNGLVDPGLILTQFSRPVVFGARHGLFAYPLLGNLLRALGTVPIYRASDFAGTEQSPTARQEANRKSLEALATRIAAGAFSALFPEGDSHDESNLQTLKTGAARLYYRARQLAAAARGESTTPVIIPVGLHYDDKDVFRSSALVVFHPPLALPAELDVTPADDPESDAFHRLCRTLTDRLELELREVTFATDSWRLHYLMRRARRLIRAERAARSGARLGRESMEERMRMFSKIRQAYHRLEASDPDRLASLREQVADYDADLRALQLHDWDLDRAPGFPSVWIAALLGLQFVGVFVFLPVVVAFGYLVNLPTAGLIIAAARVAGRRKKDEATIKLLLGVVLFPLTWVAIGILGGFGVWELRAVFPRVPDTPILGGLSLALLAAAGGIAGLRYWRFARDVARAARVRLTRRRFRLSVARLKKKRTALHDQLMALAT